MENVALKIRSTKMRLLQGVYVDPFSWSVVFESTFLERFSRSFRLHHYVVIIGVFLYFDNLQLIPFLRYPRFTHAPLFIALVLRFYQFALDVLLCFNQIILF